MPNYLYPGVYVEELPSGTHPITAVGTATAGFIGVAPAKGRRVLEAVAITSWMQFLREYVGDGADENATTDLAIGVRGFFDNQGGRCFVVNLGDKGQLAQGLRLLEKEDEVAIVAAPGFIGPANYDALLTHCENLADRVAILDPPKDVANEAFETLAQVATTGGDDGPKSKKGLRARLSKGGYGAFYFPCILIDDPLAEYHRPAGAGAGQQPPLVAFPSGHLAGVYARTDALRGVHKAPANETLRGATGLRYKLTDQDQGALNPNSVNCIRSFSKQGILVWGARTLDDEASEYRYVPVRRFVNMVEKSIRNSTRWIVFEANHEPLWNAIRRDVSGFLRLLWSQGMLRGDTADQAFFVKCDADTNTEEVIQAGQVVTLIGLAVIRPAEFVIFRINQSAGQAQAAGNGKP